MSNPPEQSFHNYPVLLAPENKYISVLSKVGQRAGCYSLLKFMDVFIQVMQKTQPVSRQVNEAVRTLGQDALKNSS